MKGYDTHTTASARLDIAAEARAQFGFETELPKAHQRSLTVRHFSVLQMARARIESTSWRASSVGAFLNADGVRAVIVVGLTRDVLTHHEPAILHGRREGGAEIEAGQASGDRLRGAIRRVTTAVILAIARGRAGSAARHRTRSTCGPAARGTCAVCCAGCSSAGAAARCASRGARTRITRTTAEVKRAEHGGDRKQRLR